MNPDLSHHLFSVLCPTPKSLVYESILTHSTMHPFPSLFGFTLLLASNSVLADNATSIFPDTFAENDRAECHACLTDLIEDTCDGPSDTSCYCTGSGAVKFRDECFITCCSATTYCQGQTYTEWWLQCVDDHPQWCHDPPKKAWGGMDLDLQEEHCSEE